MTAHCKAAPGRDRYAEFLGKTAEGFWLIDGDCRTVEVNQALCAMLGYEAEEMVGRTPLDFVDGANRSIFAAQFRQLSSTSHRTYEIELTAKDGAQIPTVFNATTILDDAGQLVQAFALVTDVSDLKQAVQDTRLKTMALEQIVDLVLITDLDGIIQYANPALGRMLQVDPERLTGQPLSTLSTHQESTCRVETYFKTTLDTGQWRGELYREKPDGTRLVLDARAFLVRDYGGTPIAFCGIATDITARKAMEEEVRRTESRYHQMFETNRAVKLIIDPRGGRIVEANSAAVQYYGYPRDVLLAMTISDINTLSGSEVREEMARACSEERLYFFFKHRLASGEVRDVEVYSGPVELGNQVLLYSIIHDVTERIRAEKERLHLTMAVNQAAEAFVITDAEGAIEYVNPAFEQVSGYTRGEALGRNPRILKSEQHDEAFYRDMWATLKAGKTWKGRIVNKTKGGALFTEDAVISPVRDESGDVVSYIGVKRDVTHEVQLESQLRQAQKLESIGRLAGGVAHDFNNMLAVILGNAELALEQMDDPVRARDSLSEIRKAAARSADLTRQLLAFARKQTIEPEVLNLNRVVSGMLKMLRRVIGEDILLRWAPADALWNTRVDPSQLDQILVNLCVNARDAIDSHGEITIASGNVVLDEAFCLGHPGAVPGEFVWLSIADTGSGMDGPTMANIFEPFFTTKAEGEGTGLGLATVYGIVKQNRGYVDVSSEVGVGTKFTIYLERHEAAAKETFPSGPETAASPGSETILLVEDEPGILKMLTLVLGELGYTVMAAASPHEALSISAAYAREIDLLVTDVVMPELNGYDLSKRLRDSRPHLPTLFISGYSADVLESCDANAGETGFLAKPFSREQFATKVREMLETRRKDEVVL